MQFIDLKAQYRVLKNEIDENIQAVLEAGQYIKFRSVTKEEYEKIEKQVEENTYKYVTYAKKEVE